MNTSNRHLIIWVALAAALFGLFQWLPGSSTGTVGAPIIFSDFVKNVDDQKVADVLIRGNHISGTLKEGQKFVTYSPFDPYLVQKLIEKGVRLKAAPQEEEFPSFLHLFLSWLPLLLLIGLSLFSLRQLQSGGNKAMSFGRSRARLSTKKDNKITFDDVAGIDEAKNDLEEIVDFLKDPEKFQRLGARIPRGVLLVGPPGTGKTLLARAIAGEANVPFFSISGSDFVEMFVGVGASRVRDMFEQTKKNAPCIVFIDEIDAVGRHRGAGLGGGNDEREQTLNQLLVEMDGFDENQGIIVIAATNRPDVLDPALLRPGRFDRQVVVPNPDMKGREKILGVHVRRVPLASGVSLRVIARGTPGFSGADLMNLVNEAALMAARRGRLGVDMADFEEAKDKILMGAERRTLGMTEEERKLTAYHEAGHAILAYYSPQCDPIHKATIVPRGKALGMVVSLPETDTVSLPREKILANLRMAMGGRLAEELVFGHEKVTTGAASDIRQATTLARKMITEWGMSETLGFQCYGEQQQELFIGQALTQRKQISEKTAESIDQEVLKVLNQCYQEAKDLLIHHREAFHRLAEALLEYETLTGAQIKDLLEKSLLPEEKSTKSPSIIPETKEELSGAQPEQEGKKKDSPGDETQNHSPLSGAEETSTPVKKKKPSKKGASLSSPEES